MIKTSQHSSQRPFKRGLFPCWSKLFPLPFIENNWRPVPGMLMRLSGSPINYTYITQMIKESVCCQRPLVASLSTVSLHLETVRSVKGKQNSKNCFWPQPASRFQKDLPVLHYKTLTDTVSSFPGQVLFTYTPTKPTETLNTCSLDLQCPSRSAQQL